MEWAVKVHRNVQKTFDTLPGAIQKRLATLLREISCNGPVRGNWKNYSKLGNDKHHCHIKSGRPTYVCCWEVDTELKIVKVYYVGTHENAPY